MAAPVAPIVFLASTLALTAPADDIGPAAVRARSASAAVAYQEDPPEDPTIDKSGMQMIILLGSLTGGVVTGKSLFRR